MLFLNIHMNVSRESLKIHISMACSSQQASLVNENLSLAHNLFTMIFVEHTLARTILRRIESNYFEKFEIMNVQLVPLKPIN
jgi:hypothetical protein